MFFQKVHVKGMNSEEIAMELLKDGVLCSPVQHLAHRVKDIRFAYTISKEEILTEWTKLKPH